MRTDSYFVNSMDIYWDIFMFSKIKTNTVSNYAIALRRANGTHLSDAVF